MIIHSRDKLMTIKLNNIEIQRCGYGLQEESVKLLGIIIDENLDWSEHIKSVVKKISKGNYLLWRYRKELNFSSKKVLQESFIKSHLLYGLSVWGGASNTKLKLIESPLKKVWRKFGQGYMHTYERLINGEMLSLKDEILIQESKILWKWNMNQLPKSLKAIIEEKNDRLRGQRFVISRTLKSNSINSRLTRLANKEMSKISGYKSTKVLSQVMKSEALARYNIPYRTRNCYICSHS